MNRKVNIYEPIWREKLPEIKDTIKKILISRQSLAMPAKKFESTGDRQSYSFRLDISYGNVTNNIGGSAVARDLRNILLADNEIMGMIKNKIIVFRMNKKFTLEISYHLED